MSTTMTFNTMLKKYMPYELLNEEVEAKNWLWKNVAKDATWLGGELQIPFEAGEASSLSFGSLTDVADITETTPVLGTVTTYPELWGTMVFHERDLDVQGNMEQTFLKLLPNKLNQFITRMAEVVSLALLNGAYVAKATADGQADGTIVVDHPERLTIGQKVKIDDDNSAAATGWVKTINMETKTILLVTAKGGAVALDISMYTVVQNAKLFTPGGETSTNAFTPLRSQLLSATNGGSATLFGQTKTSYPYLQALNISGATITSSNILEKLYDAYISIRQIAKGDPSTVLMSLKHFGSIIKIIETDRRYSVSDRKAGYGFSELMLTGINGQTLKFVAINDIDDDVIMFLDMSSLKFHGSHFFDRKRHQNGNEFFMERASTGYYYIVDIKFFGDLVCHHPSHNGIVHSISYV